MQLWLDFGSFMNISAKVAHIGKSSGFEKYSFRPKERSTIHGIKAGCLTGYCKKMQSYQ
jgi:hypothetical protein